MALDRGKVGSTAQTTGGDYLLQQRFVVLKGNEEFSVRKVDGLENEHEVHEFGDNHDLFTRLRPGRDKNGRVVIEADFDGKSGWYKWFETVIQGKVLRDTLTITVRAENDKDAITYELYDAFPCKWGLYGFNSRSSGHAVQRIEVVYEIMKVK